MIKHYHTAHIDLWRIYQTQVLNRPIKYSPRVEAYVKAQMDDYYERQIDGFGYLTTSDREG